MKKLFTLLMLTMGFVFFSCSDSDNEPNAPGMPTNLTAVSTLEEITLTWDAPEYDGRLIYDIYLQEKAGDNLMREIKKTEKTSYTHVVQNIGFHTFKVRARAFESAIAASEFAIIEVQLEAPEPPSLYTDLQALQRIMDKNPDNTLDWEFDLSDKENPKIIKGLGSGNGTITVANGRVTILDTSSGNITDLEDIKALGMLQRLLCRGTATHKLTNLDISKNRNLVYLIASGNDLKTLDVTKHTDMWALNISGNENLEGLVITSEHIKLSTLNVAKLPTGSVTIPSAIINKVQNLTPVKTDPVYNIIP